MNTACGGSSAVTNLVVFEMVIPGVWRRVYALIRPFDSKENLTCIFCLFSCGYTMLFPGFIFAIPP